MPFLFIVYLTKLHKNYCTESQTQCERPLDSFQLLQRQNFPHLVVLIRLSYGKLIGHTPTEYLTALDQLELSNFVVCTTVNVPNYTLNPLMCVTELSVLLSDVTALDTAMVQMNKQTLG